MIYIEKEVVILIWSIIWLILEYRNFEDKLTWVLSISLLWIMRMVTTVVVFFYLATSLMQMSEWLHNHIKLV